MNKHLLIAAAAAVVLAACGGGSDPPPPGPAEAIPETASQSSQGLVAYLEALSTVPADDREPLALDRFTPPAPEDTEPEPLK